MKKSFEITAVVVTGNTYAPKMEDCKDYNYTILADSPEEAEESVRKMIEKDKTRFIPLEQRIRFLNVKRTDGGAVVYKDDDQVYRRFARALRKYRMWPYLERCKEACVDFCCYSGVDVEVAAAQFAKEQDVTRSIARDARGDELTAMQQMRAEVIRQNGIRIQRANQPVDIDKPAPANNGPIYPDAGLERYHEMSSEVSKELARVNKPEQVIVVENQSANKEEKVVDKKQIIKNSNAVLMQIIDKRTNEEKHLFAEILHALHDSDCYMEPCTYDPSCVCIVHREKYVFLGTESAIKFGRAIYKEASELVDEANAKAIRTRLEELFKPVANKQQTTIPVQTDTVDNPYEEIAAEETVPGTYLDIFPLLTYKNRTNLVRRRLLLMDKGNGFYTGAVYHVSGTKLGTWYWNVNAVGKEGYSFPPVFRPAPELANVYDKDIIWRYQVAIKKALRPLGIYGKCVPENMSQYTRKVVGTVKVGQKYEPAPEPDNTIPTDSQFWGSAV